MKISRFHYTDLYCAAFNDPTGDTQKIFDQVFGKGDIEIVENPTPDDFLMDLSILFLYPHTVHPLPLVSNNSSCTCNTSQCCEMCYDQH